MKKFLFYISQNYSFEILRPIQQEIRSRGFKCAWFVEGTEVNTGLFKPDELQLKSIQEVMQFAPDATYVPGNIVPNFIPGIKVQVFHGFEWKKKGHWRIRGFFDLYCTQGPFFTQRFLQEKSNTNHFDVVETGWPKLDPLFLQVAKPENQSDSVPTILFAPTFSPSLTCAEALFDEIKHLSQSQKWHWIVKFHPKMDSQWVKRYQAIAHERLTVSPEASVLPLLRQADLMISDTSSVITEFALLGKPVVTYKNAAPEPHLIDIAKPCDLQQAVDEALQPDSLKALQISEYAAQMHPYTDGKSSARVLDATLDLIAKGRSHLSPKPLNLLRSLKLRKRLRYWGR